MPTDSKPPVSSLPSPDESADESADASRVGSTSFRWRSVLVFVVFAGIGALAGFFLGDGLLQGVAVEQLTLFDALLLAAIIPAVLLVIVALHEAGHTVAGYLAGFQLQHISVGPLRLRRTPRGWQASRSQHGFFQGMSHSVPGAALQEAPEPVVRRGRALRLVGGAAANVLTGLLALGAASALPETGEATTAAAGLNLFAVASVAVGVVNLVPFRTSGGLITDGARLVPLLRGTPAAGRDIALATVRAEAYGGTRPRDWSAKAVARMLTPRDGGMTDGSTLMLAYRHALDAGRVEDARDHLAEALLLLDRLPRSQHAGLMIEAAFFEAAHRGDAAAARGWMQRAGGRNGAAPVGVPACAAGRAEAAILRAEGEHAEARTRIAEAEAILDDHPVPGTAVAERAWLRDLAESTRRD